VVDGGPFFGGDAAVDRPYVDPDRQSLGASEHTMLSQGELSESRNRVLHGRIKASGCDGHRRVRISGTLSVLQIRT